MEECNTKIQLISYKKIPLDFWGAEQKPLVSGRAGNREGGYQIQEHDTAELFSNCRVKIQFH